MAGVMAKKTKEDTKRTYTADSLLSVARQTRTLTVAAKRIAGEMKSFGPNTIEISRQPSIDTAIASLIVWSAACEEAWADQRDRAKSEAENPDHEEAGAAKQD